MKIRYKIFLKIIQVDNSTQNLFLFNVLYSQSKSDKYKLS